MYTMRTAEHTRDFQFIMHAAGCKDIAKDARTYGGDTEQCEGATPEEAAQAWLDASGYSDTSVYETPWTLEHVKMLPCCKAGRKS